MIIPIFKLGMGQVVGATYQPITTYGVGALSLRISPYTSAAYLNDNGSPANGVYTFLNVASGLYKVFAEPSTELTVFGDIPIGEKDALLLVGNQTIAGNKTFTGVTTFGDDVLFQSAANVNFESAVVSFLNLPSSSSDPSAPTHFARKNYVDNQDAGKIGTTGNWDLAGLIRFYQIPKLIVGAGGTGAETDLPTPTEAGHFIHKRYLESVIPQSIQSSKVIRIIPEATQVTGKIYTNIWSAVQDVAGPANISNQYTILIESMGNSSFINAASGSLAPYVHLKGIGKHIKVIMKNGSTSITGDTNLENLTVVFGAGDVGTDRTFTGVNFINCDVYAYRNLILNDSLVENCSKLATWGSFKFKFNTTSEIYSNVFRKDYDLLSTTPVDAGNAVAENMRIEADPTVL